jgi:hypothetical protein
MPKFLAVHPVGKEFTLEAGEPIARKGKAQVTTDAYWIKAWYAREEGKLYCEWDAKDAESIRQVLVKEVPTEGIYELAFIVDAEDYR